MSIAPDTIVSDAELAALAKVSTRRIRQLAETGTLERVGVNQYELGPSFQALLEEAAGTGSALVRERTRKLAAEATRAELELAKAREEVAPVEHLKRALENAFSIVQTGMRRVPERAVLQLLRETNETVWKQKLRAEIDQALTQAAQPENFTKEAITNEQDESDD